MISGITIDRLQPTRWIHIDSAKRTVDVLNADPTDDWSYHVKVNPRNSHLATIVVKDETGAELGTL